MQKITVFYQNLTGNMGEGWRDQHDAGLAYGAFVEEALTHHLEAIYPDADIEVRVESQRASGYSRPLQVVTEEMSGRDELALEESLGDVLDEYGDNFASPMMPRRSTPSSSRRGRGRPAPRRSITMEWTDFARTNAQGICLETAQGHAEIATAYYTDHRVRVVVQRLTGTVHRKTFRRDEIDAAKAWAEAQLAD